jgi:agmatine deiminase
MNKRRLPAEWEEQRFVQLSFPHMDTDWAEMLEAALSCFGAIAASISQYEDVLIVCKDKAAVAECLRSARQERLHFVEMDTNDTWARDHGGITLYEAGQPVILDFVFNGWGLKFAANHDNLITGRLAAQGAFGSVPLRHGGIVLEGGGIESDGQGTLMVTSACLLSPNRNPHLSKRQVTAILKKTFGLSRILWLDHGYLAGDDTDSHIDTLARFCDTETIAYVKCADPSDEHYAALSCMEQQLRKFRTAGGQPYRLVALPMATACYAEDGHRLPATYANFLIINEAVLVPIYGVPEDEAALEIISRCFPDRTTIPIDCRVLIEQHGSLHCVTMQYPK